MQTQDRNRVMIGVVGLLLAILLVGAACQPLQANSAAAQQTGVAQQAAESGSITVVGRGQSYGSPDKAQVVVGVEIFAPTVEEATSQNQTTLDAVMEALSTLGIAPADIQTSNYSLYAEQIYGERGPEGIAGYRVSNQVNVTIRDINQVGDVLAAVTDAGANAIYGVNFSVEDPAALEAEARAEAIADARARAESLADLSGVELGDVIVVSEVVSPNYPMPMGGGFDMAVAEQAMNAPGISPGQLSFQTSVQVTYGIR